MLDSIVDSCQNCYYCHQNYRCLMHHDALLSFEGQLRQMNDAYLTRHCWTLYESRGYVIHHLLSRLSNSMDCCSWFFVDCNRKKRGWTFNLNISSKRVSREFSKISEVQYVFNKIAIYVCTNIRKSLFSIITF